MPVSDIRAKFPFAQYSAQYWIDHAKSVEAEKDAQESILDFLVHREKAYRVWGRIFDPDSLNPHCPGRWNPTPNLLYYASLIGLRRTAELLLNKGFDVNSKGGLFDKPLLAACSRGHTEIMKLLLEKGADINAYSCFGNALQIASSGSATRWFSFYSIGVLTSMPNAAITTMLFKLRLFRVTRKWSSYY